MCKVGTYYEEDECNFCDECIECPRHFYQDEVGQNHCKPCPLGTKTEESASISVFDCHGSVHVQTVE